MGEHFVSRKLRSLDRNHYWVLNDLLLPSNGNTATTQIDHLVISTFGIFCIETKMYSHWIFGSASQKYWTQVVYTYRHKFYNPVWQNYAHIKAVEQVLGKQNLKQPIVSLVVFPIANKLRITGTDGVGDTRATVNRIQTYMKPVYTFEECQAMLDQVKSADIQDAKTRRQHIRDVRALRV